MKQGRSWAVTRSVALRGTCQDQGEAAQHVTQLGAQVDPGPPAGSGSSQGCATAPIGDPSEPRLPGLRHFTAMP